jgi:NAD(P)-dependent dehydrogenase (short-subunit alcohol dehydrogenase family)
MVGIDMLEEFKLDNKIALLVGSGRSWLEILSASLAEAGADIAIISNSVKMNSSAANKAHHWGRSAETITAKVTNRQDIDRAVKQVLSHFGRIDILVNSMNVEYTKSLPEVNEAEWQQVISSNLTTVFSTCQIVGRYMLEQGAGKIINVTSCLGRRGLINSTAYCAAAGGVIQFTRALGLEWANRGITVNGIGAGWILEEGKEPDDALLRYIPMRRLGEPSELGVLVVYLAAPASDYVIGQSYFGDGGAMAHA